jgi:hypothetical protein
MVIALAGLIVWLAVVQLWRRAWPPAGALALMWGVALAAAFTDRSGIPLLAVALVATAAPLVRWRTRTAAVAVVAGVAMTGMALWMIERQTATFHFVASFGLRPVDYALTPQFAAAFARTLFSSWWFSLGWIRYVPEWWWLVVAGGLCAAAAWGLAVPRRNAPRDRAVIDSAALLIGMQLVAVVVVFYRIGAGGQGRYLFPALVPSLVLIWMGIERLAGESRRASAAAVLVTVFALLDSAAWLLVGIPAYFG